MNPRPCAAALSPLHTTTCWLVDSDFLALPLIQPGGQVQGDMVPLHEDAHDYIPGSALPGLTRQRCRRDARQPPELPPKSPESKSTSTPNGWWTRTTLSVFRKRMGKMNLYEPCRYFTLNFGCLVR